MKKEVTHNAAPYIKVDTDSKQGESYSNLPFENRQAVRNRKKRSILKRKIYPLLGSLFIGNYLLKALNLFTKSQWSKISNASSFTIWEAWGKR